ncbi:unnamed protein product [Rotaria sp. Silwood2]|nr:unnamed protein product [Rotaria sp. Silwood2]CAF3073935.1 unnamed protein product [Rotaria sp. Silwood2]CAF3206306.1 unnamed protein product [Rotaria sp. Silwood2]CAF3348271.1 unnamed protein product [Rotaria sp. Silwood2]CAF4178171.1 unnamed protein product [Rotaria sp. Silwood2]
MMITHNDFKQYKRGTRILTKTFSSTSKQKDIALGFLRYNSDTDDPLSTICMYEICNERTALDIEHISLFQDEKEVLVLPYSSFKIIDIKQHENGSPKVEKN